MLNFLVTYWYALQAYKLATAVRFNLHIPNLRIFLTSNEIQNLRDMHLICKRSLPCKMYYDKMVSFDQTESDRVVLKYIFKKKFNAIFYS